MSIARILVGLLISFATGAACRWQQIPVPCPPLLSGAFLVFSMSLGYWLVDRFATARQAKHKALCGGHALAEDHPRERN